MSDRLPFAGTTQNKLLNLLLRQQVPLSIEQIATGLKVTKTAARQHILNLERDSYVVKTTQHGGRGRPVYAYELSREGRELFTRQYALFSEKMIVLLKETLGPKAFIKQMRSMGLSLAADLAHKMPPVNKSKAVDATTLKPLANLMQELGYDAETGADNDIIAHNCVYHHLAETHPEVCELDLSLMQKLTGKKPEHIDCIIREGSSCRFKF